MVITSVNFDACDSGPRGRRRCGPDRPASHARPVPSGSASSSSASRRSSSSLRAARRVPASGRTVTRPSTTRTMISGELPTSVTLRRAQIEHERAGIHHPQRAIDLERVGLDFQFQPLADHDLKDVAGPDVFDALFDGLLEFGLAEVRACRRICVGPAASMSAGGSSAPGGRKLARPWRRRGAGRRHRLSAGAELSSRAIATTTIVLLTWSNTTMRS